MSYTVRQMEKSMRINARLDKEIAPQVHYLAKVTGLNLSEVVKKSIRYFYEQVRSQEVKPADILMKTGFVGSAQGEKNLSQTYKEKISLTLGAKHGHR